MRIICLKPMSVFRSKTTTATTTAASSSSSPPSSSAPASSSTATATMSSSFTVAASATNQSLPFSSSPTAHLRKKIQVISCSDDYLVINKPENLRMNNKKENDDGGTDVSSVEEQSSAWLSNNVFKGSKIHKFFDIVN